MEMLGLLIIALFVYNWKWLLAIAAIIGITYLTSRGIKELQKHQRERKEMAEKNERERIQQQKLKIQAEEQRERAIVSERIAEFQRMRYDDDHLLPFLRTMSLYGTANEEYDRFLRHYQQKRKDFQEEAASLNERASALGLSSRIR